MAGAFRKNHLGLIAGVAILSGLGTLPAPASAQEARSYHLAAQDLGVSLHEVARISGREIMMSSAAVRGRRAPALEGQFTAEEAVRTLLAGSGLQADMSGGTILIRGRTEPPSAGSRSAAGSAVSSGDEIVVTGSRIRGAPPTSPVISASQENIRNAGQTDLGAFARSLPQSFAGGQNPGVVTGTAGFNDANITSGSSLNLRGLGADATLTLLNGHRLAYDGLNQAVDIAAIPLAAVGRIEIVADGASALYGSDAVGGVANIILKRDYEGLDTVARLGGSTNGGDFQQQYNAVTGTKWAGGGFIVTYDFERDTAVKAGRRSYTSILYPTTTLLPSQQRHSATLSGHQDITDTLSVSGDAVFNHRTSAFGIADTTVHDFHYSGVLRTPSVTSYAIAPELEWRPGGDWTLSLSGTYGEDNSRIHTTNYAGGGVGSIDRGFYRNRTEIAEVTAEGPLFRLPGGQARLAAGGGYRSSRLASFIGTETDTLTSFAWDRNSRYFYGELYLPLVGAAQQIPLIRQLSLSGAVRYEDYPRLASIATPKIGLIYAPSGDLDFKGSWGRSFKTPTLYQQYQGYFIDYLPANFLGATPFPDSANAVLLDGANPALKPEKAETWTVTLSIHPGKLQGLHFSASYFHVDYRNRIAEPTASLDGVLINPAYADLITLNPSASLLQGLIDHAIGGLSNFSDGDYDPTTVAALVDDRFRNIARQKLHGLDLSADYSFDVQGLGSFTLTGLATYLASRQRLSPALPEVALAGTVFHPPHWRARAGGIWTHAPFTLSAYANYQGSLIDNSLSTPSRLRAQVTADLTARYQIRGASLLGGIDITLSLLNAFNAQPPRLGVAAPFLPPYDTTNYSVVGRFVSLSLGKHW